MVYAIAMPRILRSSLLILVLLLGSLGSALAMPPVSIAPAEDAPTLGTMPCHDDGSAQPEMPCCDADGDCRCSMNCFGTGSALAPVRGELSLHPRPATDSASHQPAPLPAHPQRLLRPPASSIG